jgi:TetR/AcrR family transcriptional regulator
MTPDPRRAVKRRNPQSRGQTREAEILAAARELLAGEIGEQFTLRNVADHVGMRLSHLQYYFATKGDLVRALLASVAAEYSAKTTEVLAQVPNTPTARFMAWIDYLLLDCWDPRTRHFFIRLWGMVESEDANSGQLLQEFYATDIDEIARLLQELSPHLPDDLRLRRAAIIAGIIEGMMLMVGSGPPDSQARAALLAETRKQIFRIATEA